MLAFGNYNLKVFHVYVCVHVTIWIFIKDMQCLTPVYSSYSPSLHTHINTSWVG